MSIISVILLTIVLLQWTWVLWFRRRFYWAYKKLPGPWGLPFIGIGLKVRNPETFLHNIDQLGKVYKTPFITWLGTKCLLYLNDPVNIETVLKSSACVNKADIYHCFAAAMGDGLISSCTPRWNKHRRLLDPAFSRRRIPTFLPLFNYKVNELIQKLTLSQGQSLEIYHVLKTTILEVSCQTTMGKRVNFESDESAEILSFYTSVTDSIMKRMLSPWLHPDLIFRNSGLYQTQRKAVDNIHNFLEGLLKNDIGSTMKNGSTEPITNTPEDTYESDQQNEGYTNLKPNSLIEYVRQHIFKGQLTPEDFRDEANALMAASFDTMSTTLYFVCICLAYHPKEQDKLYKELIELLPVNCEDSNIDDITLERMTYTEMVINEAMRLFAPVPFVLRNASTDFYLADGTQVPQGTQIGIDIFNMQRSEKIWGSHARSFDPERHFGVASEQHPYAFIPFTKGRRTCIGSRYALMLMKVIVAKIFRNFRVHSTGRLDDLKVKGSIALALCHYPLCRFEKRELS